MRISASLLPIQCAILVLNNDTGDDNETLGCSGPPEGSRGIHQCLAVFCSHLCVLYFTAICVSCCFLQSSMCLSVLCSHQCVLVNCVVISVSWLIVQTSVPAIARKRSQSLCPKCRWRVTAKHAYTLRMQLCMK